MSQADELLNSLSDSEKDVDPAVNENIVINSDRSVTVPQNLRTVANQFDHNVETVTFDCPRYWDGRDLSTMSIYINYKRSDGTTGCYPVPKDNITIDAVDSNIMHFDWTISINVTSVAGKLSFSISAREVDTSGRMTTCWNSDMCDDLYISENLDAVAEVRRQYPDIITYLRLEIENLKQTVNASHE